MEVGAPFDLGLLAGLLPAGPVDSVPRPAPETLARWRALLPAGQYRAAAAFVGGRHCRTYADAAEAAGVSPNTLKTQLRRIRLSRPTIWAEIAALRRGQRRGRHEAALRRAAAHSTHWHRKQFYRAYGYWPRERRRR